MRFAEPIISVSGLSKAYTLNRADERSETLVGKIGGALTAPFRNWTRLRRLDTSRNVNAHEVIWALQDVTFDVQSGDAIGIIGANGAGKSTLLKVLSGITTPTRGEAVLRGRTGSLLEVGTGFHPELTGRENVFMNGTILGMSKKTIEMCFDDIVRFSEIESFLDTPVKRYSSGMRVRLAFSIAAHLRPEILIMDEVLAVGDLQFRQKALARLRTLADEGHTILFTSHDLESVESLCGVAIELAAGGIVGFGPTREVIAQYRSRASQKASPPQVDEDRTPETLVAEVANEASR